MEIAFIKTQFSLYFNEFMDFLLADRQNNYKNDSFPVPKNISLFLSSC